MTAESTVTIVLVTLTFISGLVHHYRIYECTSCCCDSKCQKSKDEDSEADTPVFVAPIRDKLNQLVKNNNNLNDAVHALQEHQEEHQL